MPWLPRSQMRLGVSSRPSPALSCRQASKVRGPHAGAEASPRSNPNGDLHRTKKGIRTAHFPTVKKWRCSGNATSLCKVCGTDKELQGFNCE